MKPKQSNTIFIFSQHRTGSTLLKNILDANADVAMVFDEMNLFEPFRKNTFDRILKQKDLTGDILVDLIKKKKIYGTFWKDFEKSKIDLKELRTVYDKLKGDKLIPLIKFILERHRRLNNVSFSGVKYPAHLTKSSYFINSFTNSKNIFLTRNPLAIIASKINDPATKKRINKNVLFGFSVRYFTLLYICIEYIFYFYNFKKNKSALKLIFYEDIVLDKIGTISDICNYIGISFNDEMLEVTGKLSSHKRTEIFNLYDSSINEYKSTLNYCCNLLLYS